MITKAAYLVPVVGALAFVPAVLLARQSQVRLIAFGNSDFSQITHPVAEPTPPPANVVELEDTVIIGTRPRARTVSRAQSK